MRKLVKAAQSSSSSSSFPHTLYNRGTSEAKMQNGCSKTGKVTAVNGMLFSTLKRQPKTISSRQECGSCSPTASCPMFSGHQSHLDKDPPARCPASLSLISSLKGSVSSLEGSLSGVKGSVSSLMSFPTSSSLKSSNLNLHSSSPSLRSSSSSQRSSSEDDSWDTNSWSSGATCLLRSSIKQHSEEVFRVRASSGSRPERASDSKIGYQNSDDCKGSTVRLGRQEGTGLVDVGCRDSEQSLNSSQGSSTASTTSTVLEEKIEAKLKFSQFLDEVTCRVLDPECLYAFGVVRKEEAAVSCAQTSSPAVSTPHSSNVSSWFSSIKDSWAKCTPSCKILETSETLRRKREELPFTEKSCTAFLETDIDQVRREHEIRSTPTRDIRKRAEPFHKILDRKRCSSPISKRSDGAPRPPYCSTSLPRPAAAVGDGCDNSSLQEQRADLLKHLTYTTQKLHLLEKQFDSTRQYLETKLQRAQEELEKFTEKLHRIQSSYTALQRINQDLQDRIHRMTKIHEEETNALSREILELYNQLIEANITIHKLQEDNDLYRNDCKLAAQLLQCGKPPHRAHKLSELPVEFRECVSSNREKHSRGRNVALCSSHSDSVPAVITGKVLEKPEPGRSCPVTRSSSPQALDTDFMSSSRTCDEDKLQQHVLYKSSDVYYSDTALYCPSERWPEHRQSINLHRQTLGQNSADSNTEGEMFHLSFSPHKHPFCGFTVESSPLTGSYSSLSVSSEKKSHLTSFQSDWCEGNFKRKNSFSYDKESSGFSKLNSFQHVVQSSQSGSIPVHSCMPFCYTTSYHAPCLMSTTDTHGHVTSKEEPTDRWRQTSLEDIKTSLHSSGHISPYSCSEQHLAMNPKIKLNSLYSSFHDRDDIFNTHVLKSCFPTSASSSPVLNPKTHWNVFRSKDRNQGCKSKFLLSGNPKDKQQTEDSLKKDHINKSRNNSVVSLTQSLEASNVQQYKKHLQSPGPPKTTPQHHKFGNTGLGRKDSLTKAQLYGTLLN